MSMCVHEYVCASTIVLVCKLWMVWQTHSSYYCYQTLCENK